MIHTYGSSMQRSSPSASRPARLRGVADNEDAVGGGGVLVSRRGVVVTDSEDAVGGGGGCCEDRFVAAWWLWWNTPAPGHVLHAS